MARTEFDAYLMVDWSARKEPARGADSIWYCLLVWEDGSPAVRARSNPATRHQAVQEIGQLLAEMAAGGLSVLVGFDFPYGYPNGFAAALGLSDQPPWRAVWNELARRIIDRPDNSNNRFEVAADLNRVISGQAFPFWGCPEGRQSPTLSARKLRMHGPNDLWEYRIADRQVTGPQPVWKLAGVGSVGSQALLGIPHVAKLRDTPRLAAVSRVWPFETGLGALGPREQREWRILHAEIYPSLIQPRPAPGEAKDAAQVRGLALHFAEADRQGRLSASFAGNPSLRGCDRDCVEREEGWILGVTGACLALDLGLDDPGERVRNRDAALPRAEQASRSFQAAPPHRSRAAKRTTHPGYENRNGQVVIRETGLKGTDHCQYVYVLRCALCGYEYGANGSDIFQRRCPTCQGGKPGLSY